MNRASDIGSSALYPAPHSQGSAFGQVNLLYERTRVHEANRTRAIATLRALAIVLIVDATLIPYLWISGARCSATASQRALQLKATKQNLEQLKGEVAGLAPAHNYLARRDVSRTHLARWAEVLKLMEGGAGPDGFVSAVTFRSGPGIIDVDVHGEAPSLSEANSLALRLRARVDTRDLRLTSVRPAQVLDPAFGAVQYEVKGKMKAK